MCVGGPGGGAGLFWSVVMVYSLWWSCIFFYSVWSVIRLNERRLSQKNFCKTAEDSQYIWGRRRRYIAIYFLPSNLQLWHIDITKETSMAFSVPEKQNLPVAEATFMYFQTKIWYPAEIYFIDLIFVTSELEVTHKTTQCKSREIKSSSQCSLNQSTWRKFNGHPKINLSNLNPRRTW